MWLFCCSALIPSLGTMALYCKVLLLYVHHSIIFCEVLLWAHSGFEPLRHLFHGANKFTKNRLNMHVVCSRSWSWWLSCQIFVMRLHFCHLMPQKTHFRTHYKSCATKLFSWQDLNPPFSGGLQRTSGLVTGPLLPSLFTSPGNCVRSSAAMCLLPGGSAFWQSTKSPFGCECVAVPIGLTANTHTHTHTHVHTLISMEMSCISHQANMQSHIPGCGSAAAVSGCSEAFTSECPALKKQKKQRRLDN